LLARNVIMNMIGQSVPLLVAVFSIRILIRELTIERFGILTLAWAVIGYFSLFDLGLGRAVTQVVSEKLGLGRTDDIPVLAVTTITLMFGLGLLGTIVMIVISPVLVHTVLTIPAQLQMEALTSFYLLAIAIPIVVLTAGVRGILEAQQNFLALNWIRITMGIFTFVSPLAVLPFTHNLIYLILVLIAGRCVALGWHFIVCLRSSVYLNINPFSREYFSLQAITPLLRFGGWMTVSNIIGPFMVYLDRFLIGAFISVAAVSYYVTPYEIVTKLWLIPAAISSVLFPVFATSFAQDPQKVKELFSQGVKYVYIIVFPLSLIIITLAFEGITLWLGNDYAKNSTSVAQWLTVGVFINCIAQIAFALIQGGGRPDLTAKFHLLELPFYFALIFFGIKYLGIKGAAVAWVIRVIVDAGLLLYLAYRLLPKNSDSFTRILALIILSFFVLTGAMYLSGLRVKILYIAISLTIMGLVVWFKFITLQEKNWLAQYFRLTPAR
jgi:O-antigen/teichoic acid export membrane protein